MNEIKRYIGSLLNSILYRIRYTAEYTADRKIRDVINQQMDKYDNTKRQEL